MAKITNEYKVSARELTAEVGGLSFLMIFGKHINGAYVAFVGFGFSTELSSIDSDYNADRIYNSFDDYNKLLGSETCLPTEKKALYNIAFELAEVIISNIK